MAGAIGTDRVVIVIAGAAENEDIGDDGVAPQVQQVKAATSAFEVFNGVRGLAEGWRHQKCFRSLREQGWVQ